MGVGVHTCVYIPPIHPQSRVVEEIQKKLLIFSKQWNDNKLSDSVRHKMHSLGKGECIQSCMYCGNE